MNKTIFVICAECKKKKLHHAKGCCGFCYQKKLLKRNVKYLKKMRSAQKKYMHALLILRDRHRAEFQKIKGRL